MHIHAIYKESVIIFLAPPEVKKEIHDPCCTGEI